MATTRRVPVAIASPQDVEEERAAIPRVFNRWNNANHYATLVPVMWEHASIPEAGRHPQAILNEQIIEQSELLVGILWSRLGTPTPTAPSGTVDEIREFIARKGPRRVMLYFCTRDLPYNVDAAELARLRAFKEEMRESSLYQEFRTTEQLETLVYSHLDVRVRDLMAGALPLPSTATAPAGTASRSRFEFGTTLDGISEAFATQMNRWHEKPSGPDKYFALGAECYTAAASALDKFLAFSASGMAYEDREVVRSISSRLKLRAATYPEYRDSPWPKYWDEGRTLAHELVAHASHVRRRTR
jgi:hypothetical protein